MKIGKAVEALFTGLLVARTRWNGKGMSLELQVPDAHSKMTEPYVFLNTATDGRIPWNCSQEDLLADDWHVVGEAVEVQEPTRETTTAATKKKKGETRWFTVMVYGTDGDFLEEVSTIASSRLDQYQDQGELKAIAYAVNTIARTLGLSSTETIVYTVWVRGWPKDKRERVLFQYAPQAVYTDDDSEERFG